jgi:DNA-binding PadR family transcriptional regulator
MGAARSYYSFREVAGISVGASTPALKRLQVDGLVTSSAAGNRNKIEFALTNRGRQALEKGLQDWLERFRREPPRDVESVVRMAAIAVHKGDQQLASDILRKAAETRHKDSKGNRRLALANQVADFGQLYRTMMAVYESDRDAAEARSLSSLARTLRRRELRPAGERRWSKRP